jgi:hypothetical protein
MYVSLLFISLLLLHDVKWPWGRILKSRFFSFWFLSNGMMSVHICPSMRFLRSVFGFLRFFSLEWTGPYLAGKMNAVIAGIAFGLVFYPICVVAVRDLQHCAVTDLDY